MGGKKIYKKKVYKKKPKATLSKVNKNMVSLGGGFPKNVTVTHRYSDIATLVSTGGGYVTYSWSANSLYDPDVTATGHQPMLFDQFSAIYDQYIVLKAKITLKLMPASTAYNVPMTCLLMNKDSSTVLSTNPIVNAEQTSSTIKFLQMDTGKELILTKHFNAYKVFGKDPETQGRLVGTPTTSPSEQEYFVFQGQTTDGFTTQSLICHFMIEYTAQWSELKDIAQS